MTTLVITAGADKALTAAGSVAAREAVEVTLADLGSRVDEGLLLRIVGQSGLVAVCEGWTADGDDAVGTLNLNTDELIAEMGDLFLGGRRSFKLVLWSLTDQEMIGECWLSIRANPMGEDESEPQPVAPWGTDLTDVNAALAVLEDAIAAHVHDGDNRIAHGNLTGAGTLSHDGIEAALAALQAALNTHADRLAALEGWRTFATAALAAAEDLLAAVNAWRGSATSDLSAVVAEAASLRATLTALSALAPADLGWSVGAGTTMRAIPGDSFAFGDLVKVVRTLVADLKTRGVI